MLLPPRAYDGWRSTLMPRDSHRSRPLPSSDDFLQALARHVLGEHDASVAGDVDACRPRCADCAAARARVRCRLRAARWRCRGRDRADRRRAHRARRRRARPRRRAPTRRRRAVRAACRACRICLSPETRSMSISEPAAVPCGARVTAMAFPVGDQRGEGQLFGRRRGDLAHRAAVDRRDAERGRARVALAAIADEGDLFAVRRPVAVECVVDQLARLAADDRHAVDRAGAVLRCA